MRPWPRCLLFDCQVVSVTTVAMGNAVAVGRLDTVWPPAFTHTVSHTGFQNETPSDRQPHLLQQRLHYTNGLLLTVQYTGRGVSDKENELASEDV